MKGGSVSAPGLTSVRIGLKPCVKEPQLSFESLLNDGPLSGADRARLRTYTGHEQYARAQYHRRRYLRSLTLDALHNRAAYLICNAVYISSRGRYAVNSPRLPYWRDRLAATAEELVLREERQWLEPEALRHLPALGFGTPAAIALENLPGSVLFRYDKLQNLRKLRETGEVYLRCASTETPVEDAARGDVNEVSISLHLLASDLDLAFSRTALVPHEGLEFVELQMLQPDFYMFCLSTVYDWRLFGDFGGGIDPTDREETVACLVITDPRQFRNRFEAALATFKEPKPLPSALGLRLRSGGALYYDPHDARQCAPLFGREDRQPFAKRIEYAYQREYRFVVQPVLPKGYLPRDPLNLPRLERAFLRLGNLEDISQIIQPNEPREPNRRLFLLEKDPLLLSSAMGVTPPGSQGMLRFTYSVEKKELAQTDRLNPSKPRRTFRGSLQMHNQEIDIPADQSGPRLLRAIHAFHLVFDLREHGNHLISYDMRDPARALGCTYRSLLPCAEPVDDQLISQSVTFAFRLTGEDTADSGATSLETIEVLGETYMAKVNGMGEPRIHDTYRSLLAAEIEYVRRLVERRHSGFKGYRTVSTQTGWPCSELEVRPLSPAELNRDLALGPERVDNVGLFLPGDDRSTVPEVVSELILHGDPRQFQSRSSNAIAAPRRRRRP